VLKHLSIILLIVVAAGNVEAVVGESGFWLTGTGSYVLGKSEQSGQTLDGASFALTLEGMRGSDPPLSLGLSLGYASMDGEENDAGRVTKRTVDSMPLYLFVRMWLGEGDAKGYVGGGIGVYMSFLESTNAINNRTTITGHSGFAFAIPAGFVYSLNERVFLNFNYTLNWLVDNDYLENGIINAFGLGLGFLLGN
jgi:hypothetical protein